MGKTLGLGFEGDYARALRHPSGTRRARRETMPEYQIYTLTDGNKIVAAPPLPAAMDDR
jgi:hypothetical protein